MFNMNGEVIGIVSHILSRSGGFEGLGFAVTSNVAQKMLMDQKSFWSGVEGIILSGPMAELFNVPQPCGFLLQRVADNSPASRMGLKGGHIEIQIMDQKLIAGGDIILEVAGLQVDQDNIKHNRFQETLSKLHSGKSVSVKLLRAGHIMELTLTAEEK
jgi:S1-C subfamily serine protease